MNLSQEVNQNNSASVVPRRPGPKRARTKNSKHASVVVAESDSNEVAEMINAGDRDNKFEFEVPDFVQSLEQ